MWTGGTTSPLASSARVPRVGTASRTTTRRDFRKLGHIHCGGSVVVAVYRVRKTDGRLVRLWRVLMTTRAETAARREAIRAITEEIGATQLGNVYDAAVERGIVTDGGAGYSIVQCDLLKLGIGQVCKRADGTAGSGDPRQPGCQVIRRAVARRILPESSAAGMQMRSLAVLGEDKTPTSWTRPRLIATHDGWSMR